MRELRRICESRETVPASCTISAPTLIVEPYPFDSDGFGDIYHGMLDGLSVRVARLRLYRVDIGAKKVSFFHYYPLSQPSSINPTGLLQRGCNVETLEASEHCAPYWCHCNAHSVDLRLDACWRLATIYQRKH